MIVSCQGITSHKGLIMLGRVIFFIIISIFIFWANAKDYVGWKQGSYSFIQSPDSGFLSTIVLLMTIPMLVFDLTGVAMWLVLIILEVIYIAFYTWIYFKIKEERNNSKK